MRAGSLMLLLLGLVLGLAGGYLLAVIQEEPRPTPSAGASGEESRQEGATPPRRGFEPIATRGPEAEAVVQRHVEEIAALVPPEVGAPGEGRVTGRVRDAEGRPVEGVLVRLSPLPMRAPGDDLEDELLRQEPDAPPPDRLDAAVREMVAKALREQAARREGRSDAAGAFVIGGIGAGPHRLEAWCRGWHVEPEPGRSPIVTPGQEVHLVATPRIRVPVVVRAPEGGLAPRATIDVGSGEDGILVPSAAWEGRPRDLLLTAGVHVVQARTAEPVPMKSERLRVVVDAAEAPAPVTLALAVRRDITGRVTFAGEVPPRAFITCHPVPGDQALPEAVEAALESNPFGSGLQHLPGLKGDWSFAFEDVARGRHALVVRLDVASPPIHHQAVEVADRAVEVAVEVPAEAAARIVRVRVIDPAGRPAVGAAVSCELAGNRFRFRDALRAGLPARDEQGAPLYEIALSAEELALGGTVTARLEDHGAASQPLAPGATEAVIRIRAGARLEVSVPGASAHPAYDTMTLALATAPAAGGPPRPEQQQPLSEGGDDDVLIFGPHQPGRYRLQLHSFDGGETRFLLLEQDVTLASGLNRVSLALPHLQDLTVAFPRDYAGRQGMILRDGAGSSWSEMSRDIIPASGEVTFENLPPGRYLVSDGFEIGGSWMTVTLPGPGRVRFEGKATTAYRVRIDDASGLLAQAGFEDGDLLVSVGGAPLEARNQRGLDAAWEGTRTEVGVLRRGRELALTVDLGETLRTTPVPVWGGFFLPATR